MWEETAARMVDAQAPGLAARVRELGAIPASGADWPSRLLEECALLHLLDRGWLGRERLPAPWPRRCGPGSASPSTPRRCSGPAIRDSWLVLAQYDTADERLTTRRIWLYGGESGRSPLILSFGAAGRAPELALPVGLVLDAELAFHPAAVPLRAALGARYGTAAARGRPRRGTTVGAALDSYGTALADDPWLDAWPVVLCRRRPHTRRRRAGNWPTPTARTRSPSPPPARRPLAPRRGLRRPPRHRLRRMGPTGLRALAVWREGDTADPIPL